MKARHDKGCSAFPHLAYQNYLFPSPRLKNGQDDVPFPCFSHHENLALIARKFLVTLCNTKNPAEPTRPGLTTAFPADWALSDSQVVRTVPKTEIPCAVGFSGRNPCTPGVSRPWPTRRCSVKLCHGSALFYKTLHCVQPMQNPQPPQQAWAEPVIAPLWPLHKKGTQSPSAGGG